MAPKSKPPIIETTFIGKCNFRGNEKIFGIKRNDRRQHMYVIGKTGVGKSALLKNLALQDIRNGQGIAIIDPHGEFVEEVLSQIPSERTNDVVYFNPVDSEFPMGFNVLEVPDQRYKHLVVSDLLGIFTKIWANVWSARMEYILQNCIMALLDTPGTTLLGIPRLLVDKDYRQNIVANVKDPVVKSFWVHEYETWRDQFRNEAIVPIQNKVNQFLNTSFIRNIVGQPTSTLNIPEIMNAGKILLVNVAKGKVGEDNSALLGAMIITKVQLAAMERVRIPENERKDFYLYVDEFQNFATDSFASILSEARKYRLDLIIAHQYVGQLETDVSTKVRDAVFGNVGTMISFRVGAADAEYLEKEYEPEFMMQDLINLPNHHVYLKLMVDGVTSRPFSAVTLPPMQFESDKSVKDKIVEVSRNRYANHRDVVEDRITRWSGFGGEEGNTGGSSTATALPAGQLIETPCWNCGKTATVPFKPDGKRPVYCMSCLKQIEEGKLIPIPERMPKVGREKFGQSLAGIGIEFANQGGSPSVGAQGASGMGGGSAPIRHGEREFSGNRDSRGGGGARSQHAPSASRRDNQFGRPFDRAPASGRPAPSDRHDRSFDKAQGKPGERRPDRGRDFPTGARPAGDARSRGTAERGEEKRGGGIRSQPLVRTPQNVKPVSLAHLKPKEENSSGSSSPKNEARAGETAGQAKPNLELKKLLEEALRNSTPPPPLPKAEKKEPPRNATEPKEQGSVVNPGDIIMF